MNFENLAPELLALIFSKLDPIDIVNLRKCNKQLLEASRQRLVWVDQLRNVQTRYSAAQNLHLETLTSTDIESLATKFLRFPQALRTNKRLRGAVRQHKPYDWVDLGLHNGLRVQCMALAPGGRYLVTLHYIQEDGSADPTQSRLHLWDLGVHPVIACVSSPIASIDLPKTSFNRVYSDELIMTMRPPDGSSLAPVMIGIHHNTAFTYEGTYTIIEIDPSLGAQSFFPSLRSINLLVSGRKFVMSHSYLAFLPDHSREITVWNFMESTLAKIKFPESIPTYFQLPLVLIMDDYLLVLRERWIDVLHLSRSRFYPASPDVGDCAQDYQSLVSQTFHLPLDRAAFEGLVNTDIETPVFRIKHYNPDREFTTTMLISVTKGLSQEGRAFEVLSTSTIPTERRNYYYDFPAYLLPDNSCLQIKLIRRSHYTNQTLMGFLEEPNSGADGNAAEVTRHNFHVFPNHVRYSLCPMTGRICVCDDEGILILDYVGPLGEEEE